jgi:deoxyribonuclease IV
MLRMDGGRRPFGFSRRNSSSHLHYTHMPFLGAHQSIAGGYYKAVETAHATGCHCVQLFTKNNNQWRAKDLVPDDVARFQSALVERGIDHPLAHNSYLINLGSPDKELWIKSIDAMVVEVARASLLGIPYVVAHPGAFTTSSEQVGLERIATGLDEVHRQTKGGDAIILLETTAGQGSCLGCDFEHLAEILSKVADPDRLGVCFDTCHVFAAGYPLGTAKEYRATMREFDKLIGYIRIKAFHLNDSVKPLGSRVDRHAAIGKGEMGLEPFRLLLGDRRFHKVPKYLETPKGKNDEGEDLDIVNLRTLRSLVAL